MAYSLGSIPLGTVTRESMDKTSDLDIMPFPLSDSDDTQAFDFNGAKREIRIEGMINGATNISNFITAIEAVVDGTQDTAISYTSDIIGTKNVKIKKYSFDYTNDGKNLIKYRIEMIESI